MFSSYTNKMILGRYDHANLCNSQEIYVIFHEIILTR